MQRHDDAAAFAGMVDLASARLGGRALLANDEFFAAKENLLRPEAPVFDAERYTPQGKWMDGWETRRRRTPGFDWLILRLGMPGTLAGVDIDTRHFLGNYPPYASLEGCCFDGPDEQVGDIVESAWQEVLPRAALAPGRQNLFGVSSEDVFTHLRLKIYPDGGIARLRIYGRVRPDWGRYEARQVIDLASIENGGRAVACSDMFFSDMQNLLLPEPAMHMGDGWETRRRRGPGHDWVIVQLACTGHLRGLEIDTSHFKGNFPHQVSMDACHRPEVPIDALTCSQVTWKQILAPQAMAADTVHVFDEELLDPGPWTYVRMNIHPDGGVARLRVFGVVGSA